MVEAKLASRSRGILTNNFHSSLTKIIGGLLLVYCEKKVSYLNKYITNATIVKGI